MRPIVCHIITRLEVGGAQLYVLNALARLNQQLFQPVLIAGEPDLLDGEARRLPGIPFLQVPHLRRDIHPAQEGFALHALTRLLKDLRPAVVHTHCSKAGVLGRLAAAAVGVPMRVHTFHGYGFHGYQRPEVQTMLRGAERLVAPLTTRFVAVSEANKRKGIEAGLFSAAQCEVIRPGVPLEPFAAKLPRDEERCQIWPRHGLDPHRPVVGMVAGLIPQKAPLDFVAMARRVVEQRPDVQLVMVGDGPLRGALEARIHAEGLASHLHLLGWQREIPALMRSMDVFVLTSLWEGLPRVYVEALASGTPVVGTAVDGAPEVVIDGENGFLVPPHAIQPMAERVLYLLNNPAQARRMGERGRQLPPGFSLQASVIQLEQLYQRLLSAHSVPARHPLAPQATAPQATALQATALQATAFQATAFQATALQATAFQASIHPRSARETLAL